jgi:3-deoxy-D-manno-octulosonic-acid transferase
LTQRYHLRPGEVNPFGRKRLDRGLKDIYRPIVCRQLNKKVFWKRRGMDKDGFLYAVYNAVLALGSLFIVPYYAAKIAVTGKYRKSVTQQLGFIPPEITETMKGQPRIWVHAVSVGEVTAAAPIVAALRASLPEACLVLSTSTETGQEMAGGLAPEATALMYYPLDIPAVVRKVIGLVRPDIFVITETELWPNFLRECSRLGIRVAMVNGRISPRSFGGYVKTRFLWEKVLRGVAEIGVISEIDAERIRAMGADPGRVRVLGNAKYDGLASRVSPALREEIARAIGAGESDRFLVAGSTHEGEEDVVFDVYRKLLPDHPDLRLIVVPRHIDRGEAVFSLAKQKGFEDAVRMTEIRAGKEPADERVIIIDVIGELFKVYGLATLVFCGGSLVPRGGQNILEAAAWGKVVLYGPSMEDFLDEKGMLEEAGAGITIRNGDELYRWIDRLLRDPETLEQRGESGRSRVMANRGASKRYAELIIGALGARR